MQLKILQEIIKKKNDKTEFAIITNLETGSSEIFETNKAISKEFEKYKDQINNFYKNKKMELLKVQIYLLKLISDQLKLLLLERFI